MRGSRGPSRPRVLAADVVLLAAVTGAGFRIAVLHGRVRALQAQVIRDPLTGAFNRRHLHTALAAAVERRRRGGERAALLYLDIDRFKAVNDVLGHATGDRVLRDLVALVSQRLRKVDALFRVGGEEFALLLSGAGLSQAVAVAETLRALVDDAGILPQRQLSISIGVVELGPGQTVTEWMAAADAALYRAKRTGRNRVAARFSATPAPEQTGTRLSFPVRTS